MAGFGAPRRVCPPSLLRNHAQQGDAEVEELIGRLTTSYEERLRRRQIANERREALASEFVNRSNLWLSMVVLLFSIVPLVELPALNAAVVGVALVFVLWVVGSTLPLRRRVQRRADGPDDTDAADLDAA